ncbi:hypothetical protein AK812_SmicGene5211 [Symbiodinium microadriaticum]|uniref:Uncharacterized protein n=1 Tax=Symbiodinium microadriaticum TaxID=2951 RepID=A0A1Q9EU96_SYMMI|nr:hypothetical protein AK812_SmicGene5211 [Symbiodinium microadriaticum]
MVAFGKKLICMNRARVEEAAAGVETATGIGTVIATGIVTGIVAIATGIAVAKCLQGRCLSLQNVLGFEIC